MYQEGEVTIAECESCKEIFPVFTFVADTDMVTIGCVSLSAKNNKIGLTMQQGQESEFDIEARVGSGYKIVPVRFINNVTSNKGASFQAFSKHYKPPKPIYTCISCGSDAQVCKTETKEQFLTYGTIEVINGS